MILVVAPLTDAFLVHYHEVALKGRNRPWFVQALVRHLRAATSGLGVREVRPYKGRVEVALTGDADEAAIAERLRHTFGIANFSRTIRCAPDEAAIAEAVMRVLPTRAPDSFRVAVKRSDKRFPLPSPELERRLGAAIVNDRGWSVQLRRPGLIVRVDIVSGAAYCEAGRETGAGGLPSGVSGRVLCLVSGGIDSPVAAWRMMRRGCRADFVHFHSVPLTSAASQGKVRALVRRLCRFQLGARLALVPLADIQRNVAVVTPPQLRTVVYRRFMLRVAEVLARRWDARAVVTGDALGQVASQTLDNLALVGEAVTLPLLRPLVALDKEEVVAVAQRIGTFDTSVQPADDACTIFAPRRVATSARRDAVVRSEQALDVTDLVSAAAEAAVIEHVEPDW